MGTTVTLSPHISDQVNELVAAGQYASTDQAVEHLLTQYFEEPAPSYSAQELAELREAAAQADRGEFVPPEEIQAFFDDWRRKG